MLLATLIATLLVPPTYADETLAQPAGSGDDVWPSVVSKQAATAERFFWDGRLELKRENTNRGTPDETTKTITKVELYPPGVVSLLRLEVPFPDEQTDLEGSSFDPHLGDVKVRAGFGPFPGDGTHASPFLEMVFPTANPDRSVRANISLSQASRWLSGSP